MSCLGFAGEEAGDSFTISLQEGADTCAATVTEKFIISSVVGAEGADTGAATLVEQFVISSVTGTEGADTGAVTLSGAGSPADVTNLTGWWAGDQGVTIVTGVSNWADQSGNGNALVQATTGKQPVRDASALHGLPGIHADGVDDFLTAAFTLAEPYTISGVMRVATAGVAGVHDILTDGNGAQFLTGCVVLDSTPQEYMYAGALSPTVPTAGNPFANYVTFMAVFNGSSSALYIGNTLYNSGNVGNSRGNPGGLTLFAAANGTRSSPGIVTELTIHSKAVTSGDRAILQTYLANKFAL